MPLCARRVRPLARGAGAHLLAGRRPSLHALAGHPPLREFSRGQLPAAQAPAPGFLQRLRLLPLGRRSGRRDRRHAPRACACWPGGAANWTPCTQGRATHPVFVALAGHGRSKYDLPTQPFADLISAFVQDQTVTRYRNWDELFGYCRYSANPVGRLVLYLCGYSDAERAAPVRRHLHRPAARQFLAGRDRGSAQGPRLHSARRHGAARLHGRGLFARRFTPGFPRGHARDRR